MTIPGLCDKLLQLARHMGAGSQRPRAQDSASQRLWRRQPLPRSRRHCALTQSVPSGKTLKGMPRKAAVTPSCWAADPLLARLGANPAHPQCRRVGIEVHQQQRWPGRILPKGLGRRPGPQAGGGGSRRGNNQIFHARAPCRQAGRAAHYRTATGGASFLQGKRDARLCC